MHTYENSNDNSNNNHNTNHNYANDIMLII